MNVLQRDSTCSIVHVFCLFFLIYLISYFSFFYTPVQPILMLVVFVFNCLSRPLIFQIFYFFILFICLPFFLLRIRFLFIFFLKFNLLSNMGLNNIYFLLPLVCHWPVLFSSVCSPNSFIFWILLWQQKSVTVQPSVSSGCVCHCRDP